MQYRRPKHLPGHMLHDYYHRLLAFVMTIFQKIAASSFAAVQRTLRRRLIALTIQEALIHGIQKLDIEARNAALDEARMLIRELPGIAEGRLENAEVDKLLADYRYKILRQQREEEMLGAGADEFASETGAAGAEDAAMSSVSVALPEERRRIGEPRAGIFDSTRNEG